MSTVTSTPVDALRELPEEKDGIKADHLERGVPVGGEAEPPLRVMALHALLYCERLFYLEEVEEIRVADAAVYAGRRLHVEVASPDDETPEQRSLGSLQRALGPVWQSGCRAAPRRGLGGHRAQARAVPPRRRRPSPGWPSDRIQAVAYAVLLEEALGEPVPQARVRYHADGVTAFVEVDEAARRDLAAAVERARELRRSTERPPVAENENLCPRCSLGLPAGGNCLPQRKAALMASMARERGGARGSRQTAQSGRRATAALPLAAGAADAAHRLAAGPSGPQRRGLAADQRRREAEDPRRTDRQRRGPRVRPGIDAGHPPLCPARGGRAMVHDGRKVCRRHRLLAGTRAAADPSVRGPVRSGQAARPGPAFGRGEDRHAAALRSSGQPGGACLPRLVPPPLGADAARAGRRAQGRIGRLAAGAGRDRRPRIFRLPEGLGRHGRTRGASARRAQSPPAPRPLQLPAEFRLCAAPVARSPQPFWRSAWSPRLGFYHQPRTRSPAAGARPDGTVPHAVVGHSA